MKNFKVLSLCLLMGHSAFAQTSVTDLSAPLSVDAAQTEGKISEYLTGGHFVYGFENDTLYQDERISDWMKECKTKTIRWPGGTAVQTYHWDDLNGIAFKADTWKPGYNGGYRDSVCFMDLDEYIAFCRKIGAEPMVGINIQSGNKYKGEGKGLEGSLEEARRLIQYCKDKDYQVKNWYIGNECYIMFRKENYIKYADFIDRYAAVLRSVDPDINVIGDWQFGGRLDQIVNIIRKSKEINMMEIHEKWGNGFGMASGNTFEDWKKEYPIYKGNLGKYIERLRDSLQVMGRDDVKIAMNEWGLSGKSYPDGDEFKCGLIAADFLMELFRHRVDMACYWNFNMGSADSRILKVKTDTITDGASTRLERISPVGNAFTLLATAMGKQLVNFTTPLNPVYGFAAVDEEKSTMDVYLLNKSEEEVVMPLQIQNMGNTHLMTQYCYAEPGLVKEKIYEKGDLNMVLPALSFSHFVIAASEATHIDEVKAEEYQQSDLIFDFGGHRVLHPEKGVYIVNGKKILVK